MKKLLLFALLCVPAFGQVHSDIATQNTVGNWVKAIPGAFIYVCTPNTADASCLTGLGGTTLYTDSGLTVTVTPPIIADSNGNYTFYATPGIYKQCVKAATSFCQLIEVAGIGTPVGVPFTCPSAVNGSVMAMTSTTTSSCDPNGITDFIGHWTSQSYRATGSFNGTVELTGGLADPTNAPDTNSVAFLAPTAVPTPYYLRPPASTGTVGQCLQLLTQDSGTNGIIDALQWATCAAGAGTVTSFSAGNLSPLFTTSVATATSTPALTFSLTNAAANTVFGNFTGSSGAPSYNAISACGDATHALAWTAGTGFTCQAISAGTTATFQVNAVNTTSQTTINFQDTNTVAFTNPSAGNVQAKLAGSTTIGTPTAPTLSTNGSAGATSRTYAIVGCEDVGCVYHTPASSTTTIATTNATLTSGNSVNLSAYGDTLYGPRCFNVYRTASAGTPSTTGLIAACVGKRFIDTGLAGDGTTAPVTNTTILTINMSPNPGCNIPPNGMIGVDAPPCSPTAFDDEMGPTFLTPGNTQVPDWVWQNQGSATAVYTGGTIVLTTDAGASPNMEMLQRNMGALPSPPYTFHVFLDNQGLTNPSQGGLALRESSTGKIAECAVLYQAGSGGMSLYLLTQTSYSSAQTVVASFPIYGAGTGYVWMQNSSGNINCYYSAAGDGIGQVKWATVAVTTAFTTAPDQVLIFASRNATGTIETFDWFRRTQ